MRNASIVGICIVLAVGGLHLVLVPSAVAEGQPPPVATQHALDELANCRARRGAGYAAGYCSSPTPTPSPTVTPSPSPLPSATSTAPAVSPMGDTGPTPTPGPCWLTDPDLGDPDGGYVVFDDSGAPVPCPSADVPTELPTEVPTDTPTATPTPPPTAPVSTVVYLQQPAPPPQVEVRTVVQTVVVPETVVVLVSATPAPPRPFTPTPRPPSPTPTRTPTATPTATATPSSTAQSLAFAAALPTQVPRPVLAFPSSGAWDWGVFLRALALVVVLVCAAVWLLMRRRVAVWRSR